MDPHTHGVESGIKRIKSAFAIEARVRQIVLPSGSSAQTCLDFEGILGVSDTPTGTRCKLHRSSARRCLVRPPSLWACLCAPTEKRKTSEKKELYSFVFRSVMDKWIFSFILICQKFALWALSCIEGTTKVASRDCTAQLPKQMLGLQTLFAHHLLFIACKDVS